MNSFNDSTGAAKRRSTSIPLLVGVVILGVAAFFVGPTVMAYVMLFQEQSKANEMNEIARKAKPLAAGERTERPSSGGAESAGGGPGQGGPGPNLEELFQRRDEDANGRLEGSEISERMQARVAVLDKDGDGAITKEEFLAGRPGENSNNAPAAPAGEVQNQTLPESITKPASVEPNTDTPKE